MTSISALSQNLQSAIAASDAALADVKANWYSNFKSVRELRKLAADAGIQGRSKMNKAELCAALAQQWVSDSAAPQGAEEEWEQRSLSELFEAADAIMAKPIYMD